MNNLISQFLRKRKIADVIQKLLKRINNLHISLKFVKNHLESILNLTQYRKITNNTKSNRIEKKKNKCWQKKIKKKEKSNKNHL